MEDIKIKEERRKTLHISEERRINMLILNYKPQRTMRDEKLLSMN